MTDDQLRQLFEDDLREAAHDARVPGAAQVWWRAAMRARTEAARAAERPLTWSQGIAAACVVGFAAASAGVMWPAVARGASFLGTTTRWATPLAIVLAACIALVPLLILFAFTDE